MSVAATLSAAFAQELRAAGLRVPIGASVAFAVSAPNRSNFGDARLPIRIQSCPI